MEQGSGNRDHGLGTGYYLIYNYRWNFERVNVYLNDHVKSLVLDETMFLHDFVSKFCTKFAYRFNDQ